MAEPEDMFEYSDGKSDVKLDEKAQMAVLAEIMNRTEGDPDSLAVGAHDKEIVAIVRDVFKVQAEAADEACVRLWAYFLNWVHISEMMRDE